MVACLISSTYSSLYSQVIDSKQYNYVGNWYNWQGGRFINNLNLPKVTATTGRDTGAIRYALADSSVYVWTGSQWRQVAGGSGADSSVFATRYYAQQTFVPYTGATGSVNLGLWGLTTDRFVFNQTPTLAGGERIIRWNDTDGTLDVGMKGGNVTLQVGQEQHSRVRNNTGSTITNGQVVYISGSTGTNTTVALAKADASSTSQTTIGIATEDIPNGQSGFVTTFGKVRDINTIGLTEGSPVYLSSTVAGGLTSTAPTGDTYPIMVGICERTHAANGVIFVHVDREFARKYQVDTALANRLQNITGLVTAGTNVTITGSGTSGSPYVVNSSGGGSADSTYQTIEIGTDYTRIGTVLNESFTGGSIPAGWSAGGNIGQSYTGSKLTVTGATYWGAPSTNNNTAPWLSAMQYDTERMIWEKYRFEMYVVPTTASAGGIVAVTHGSNGFTYTSRPTVAWDLGNGTNSGRSAVGTDSITVFTNANDSTSKMSWSVNDSLILYFEKDGWNVTHGIVNKTTGKKTITKTGVNWNGIGGRTNLVFLNGTYVVTNVNVDVKDRVGGVWVAGHSRASGSGATTEQRRYANLLFNSNYKYFGVTGFPGISAKRFDEAGITSTIITRAQPEKVIIDLGSNDLADFGLTPAQAKVFVDSIGSQLDRATATDIVIIGQFPSSAAVVVLNDSLSSLSTQRGWTFVPVPTELTLGSGLVNPRYSNDGVHYNDSGQVIIAQKTTAKAGFKLHDAIAADTIQRIKFHGVPNVNFKNGWRVAVLDNEGNLATTANEFPTPAQYIQNKYTANSVTEEIQTVAQENTKIHISGPVETDSVLIINNANGLRLGFNANGLTTRRNIEMTNVGATGGYDFPQGWSTFDINSTRNFIAQMSSVPGSGAYTFTNSSDNVIFGTAGTATALNGANNNLALNVGAGFSLTTGDLNIGLGKDALRGVTTGNSNFHAILYNPGAASFATASLTNTVIIGDIEGEGQDPTQSGDISISNGFVGRDQNFWWGMRGCTNPIYFNAAAIYSGTNVNGNIWYQRASRGRGTGVGGLIKFQSWNAGSTGTTLNSSASDELDIENKKIVVYNRFQTSTGANVASANDLTLGNDGNVFHITGTTQINAITTTNWQAGSEIILIFDASVTVKNNTAGGGGTAVMLLAGAADFSATANDVLKLIYDGTSWYEVSRSVN